MKTSLLGFLSSLLSWMAVAQSPPMKTDSLVLDSAVLYYHRSGSDAPIVILSGGPG